MPSTLSSFYHHVYTTSLEKESSWNETGRICGAVLHNGAIQTLGRSVVQESSWFTHALRASFADFSTWQKSMLPWQLLGDVKTLFKGHTKGKGCLGLPDSAWNRAWILKMNLENRPHVVHRNLYITMIWVWFVSPKAPLWLTSRSVLWHYWRGWGCRNAGHPRGGETVGLWGVKYLLWPFW